ncbi:MAG TPA: ATP-binding protein [Anaerolineales bacterium]|nr:ATP-binding protein [Anaerolineales bacterium]
MNNDKLPTKSDAPTRGFPSWFDIRSFPVQIILGFIGIALLTSLIAGLPAIWLIRQQLQSQAWSQIDQGQRAVQAIYAAQKSEIASSARLIAQRPTLRNLIAQGDQQVLQAYLHTLQEGEELDVILVCSPDDRPVVMTTSLPPEVQCSPHAEEPFYYIDEPTRQLWLLAGRQIEDVQNTLGRVVVGIRLDNAFAEQMHQQTGLEHAILYKGDVLASSHIYRPDKLTFIPDQPALLSTPIPGTCCTFELDDQPYYAARLPLDESGSEMQLALPVAQIAALQKRLVWVLLSSVLVVAGIGSFVGVLLARRISQPMVGLAQIATQFSQGNLSTPVRIHDGAREVVQLSQALETARRDLQKILSELRNEKNWVNHLLESIVEGIMTLDEAGRITFFSQGAERITGWSREQVLDRSCDEVIRLLERDILFSQSIPLPGQKSKVLVELASGNQATLSITRALVSPAEADEAEIALVFRDVSEEEIVHRLLSYFLANVAHEFRTPLSALAASVELLMDQASDLAPDELDELLKSLHLGILSLQTLVDNLLESASIEAGHFRVSPRPSDLASILQDAIRTMMPLLEKYNQKLVPEIPADLPLVQADPRRIVQVLVNLLSNASKYGPPDEEITLGAMVNDDWVRVIVADRGPGISLQNRDLVFRRLEYSNAAERRAKVGAGIGLSVVKAVVEAHGGQTFVDERPGGGSIFWFTLPVARET